MTRAAAAVAAMSVLSPWMAGADEPRPVTVEAGKALNLCTAGLARCPVSTVLCDDPKVAVIENGAAGAELKGVSPGTTLCSAIGDQGAFRTVMRVTVEAAGPKRCAGAPP